jgi:RNA polymerase sigma-70 factor (ECF subfamily)
VTTAALAPFPAESPQHDDDFTGLFRSYHPQLLRYVTHHFGPRDADEITQEALTRALRSLDRGRSDAETWAWLIRVARNIAYDFARSRRICESTDDAEVLHCEAPNDTTLPEPAALLDERRRMVRRALKVLPPTQRRILVLYEVDDLNCPTIASLVGSTEDAVRKSLQRARRRFAAEVRALGGGSAAITWWLRGFRRRPRGLSALTASTALCAVAGSVVLTVTTGPATAGAVPRLAEPVSVSVPSAPDRPVRPAPARVAPAKATKAAPRTSAARPKQGRPVAPPAKTQPVLKVPHTALSPGARTRVYTVVYTSAGDYVAGTTVENGHGPVCQLSVLQCD